MKTKMYYLISLVLVTLLSSCLNTNSQTPTMEWQKKNNQLTDINREHVANPMLLNNSDKNNPLVHNKKSLTWHWDTIIAYDTLGISRRLTSFVDTNGNMLTDFCEYWHNNTWIKGWRHSYTYDASNNMLTDLYESYLPFYEVCSHTYTYDANGNRLTDLFERLITNWVNEYRETYTYNANGNRLTDLRENWDTNAWVNDHRHTHTYDTNGNTLSSLYEFWQNNIWVGFERETYTYDANGNTLTDLKENWHNNTWINYYRSTYTYDANGNRLTYLFENWQINAWLNSGKATYTYDVNGNMLIYLLEDWQNNAWVNYYRSTYTYDANGNRLTYLNELWQTNAWVNTGRTTHTYDANGNRLTDLNELWQTNAWVSYDKRTYTYDANGNSLTGKYEIWQAGNWQPSQTGQGHLSLYSNKAEVYFFDGLLLEDFFDDIYRYEARYTSFISGIANIQVYNDYITVFPNPSSGIVNIKTKDVGKDGFTVEITNLSGQLVYFKQFNNATQQQIDLTEQPKGMYFVKVQGNDLIKVEKLIVE